jgi:putative transposase
MTAPRQIRPNTTYLITRRYFGRMFLLRPSPLVTAVFEYVLAAKAQQYGIVIHAYCVLSNHWHCVLTDSRGNLPRFQRDLGSTIARALNAAHGRWESFWAPGSYSATAL